MSTIATDESPPLLQLASQAQVVVSNAFNSTVEFQHAGSAIGAEPTLDFEDGLGIVWSIVDDGPNTRVKATPSLSIPSGTSFPSSPVDTQEYIYIVDQTNGIEWRFKWNATGSYWAFQGGPPLRSEITSQETTTSLTYAALGTAGPAIVLPFAADYDVEVGCGSGNTTNAANAYMSYDIGATGASDNDAVRAGQAITANSSFITGSRPRRKTGLAAVTLTAKYRVDQGTGIFTNRWISVLPVKK